MVGAARLSETVPGFGPLGARRSACATKFAPGEFVDSLREFEPRLLDPMKNRPKAVLLSGRGGEIRTRDPCNPIAVRYQTAPRPDS